MKNTIFKGIGTALITPLDENGINYDHFGRLIDWQIESGIDALVACGTTGEGPTLTDEGGAFAPPSPMTNIRKLSATPSNAAQAASRSSQAPAATTPPTPSN